MAIRAPQAAVPKRLPLLFLCSLLVAGCGAANLGDIDETQSERDAMPGPGVFTGEDGVARFGVGEQGAAAEQGTEVADAAVAPAPGNMDEKAEFEAFKEWQRLRARGAESEEYREFLQWLEFRRFKAGGE